MKILFIGDVIGTNGVNILRRGMPDIKKQYKPDITIVNGENSAENGKGLTKREATDIFACGADIITGGNHSMDKTNIDFYMENEFILCPANFYYGDYSCGVSVVDLGRYQAAVINLIGTAFIQNHKNPFFVLDDILKNIDCKDIIVDFHAESTAEKMALAHYADGRVSAVIGTHTHVQTNDDQILPGGTAYLTDAGSVCADNSVIGIIKEAAIEKQKYLKPVQFKIAKGEGIIHGVFIETDKNGKAISIEKIKVR